MFNSINCNGPPIRGFFIIWSILYRVDLFVLSDWILPGFPPGIPGAYTQSYMDPGTILVSRRVPITHDKY